VAARIDFAWVNWINWLGFEQFDKSCLGNFLASWFFDYAPPKVDHDREDAIIHWESR